MTATSDALSVVETYDAAQASESTIYRGEGTGVSKWRKRREQRPSYFQDLSEAMGLYDKVLRGDKYAALDFSEAMSTSDFPLLFGDIIDRQMLASYRSLPVRWDAIARRGRVRDFRTVSRHTVDGGESILLAVPELTEYPASSIVEGRYQYKVGKFGRRMPISWEAFINDDLDGLRGLPTRLSNAARKSEERFVTDLYAGPSGPDATFFSVGNNNLISEPLTVPGLEIAFAKLAAQVDTDGNPIYIEGVTLVVPPALEITANNLVSAAQIWTATGSGGASSDAGRANTLQVANWISRRVSVVVNPWLPIISSTANGNTAWYLFANPNEGRPAMEVGFLVGHEEPELFQKSANATRVGGGPVGPEEGDFDTDTVDWKVRHVFGGTLMDPKMAIGSDGV